MISAQNITLSLLHSDISFVPRRCAIHKMIFIRSVLGLVVLLRLVCANSATHKDPWISKYNEMNANYSRSAWARLFREGRHSDCNPKTVLVRKAWESKFSQYLKEI